MSYPVLTPASWSRGRYESYVLHPNGTLVGTVHPPGLAFELVSNREEIPSDHILFLSSRNQKCSGKWFICANLLQPYRGMATGSRFLCELILLMGATSNTSTLLQPDIILHYWVLLKSIIAAPLWLLGQEFAGYDFGTFGQTCEKQVWLKSIIVAPGGCQVKFWAGRVQFWNVWPNV